MTFALVRREATEEMNWAGWRAKDAVFSSDAEPMVAPAAAYHAMLTASPPLTDEDIDGLCRAMWGDAEPWKAGLTTLPLKSAEAFRNEDRARMRAFLAAIGAER